METKQVEIKHKKQVEAKVQKDYEEIVEAWFKELVHNSRLSRDTDTYNEVRAAVNVLKARVK